MKDRSRKYEIEPILRLAEALKDDDRSYQWLATNDYKELAALRDVILLNSDSAKNWLQDHNFATLSAFISAINNNESAFNYLLECDYKEWAAVFSCIYNDDQALDWLVKHDIKHYGYLAQALYTLNEANAANSYFAYINKHGVTNSRKWHV